MDIRLAAFDDLPGILAISNWAAAHTAANFAIEPESLESWQASWQQTHERFPWFVAEESGAIVGFAKASPWKGRCAYAYSGEISVYVDQRHHGRGIARALYDRLLATMRAQGFHTVLGGITQPNPASVRLHESFGGRRVATFEHIGWKFGHWHDVSYWQIDLRDPQAPPSVVRSVADAVAALSQSPGKVHEPA